MGWKCSFSTIRQILCQWNSPEEICTKCKNNPVSFHPKILHSQRGSTFFFIYFSLLIFLSLKIYRKSLSHKKITYFEFFSYLRSAGSVQIHLVCVIVAERNGVSIAFSLFKHVVSFGHVSCDFFPTVLTTVTLRFWHVIVCSVCSTGLLTVSVGEYCGQIMTLMKMNFWLIFFGAATV